VEFATEKWGGRPHYRGVVHVLGEDEHGTWLWGPAGRVIYRGDEPLFTAEHDVITVITSGAWWAPAWWLGHLQVDLYVNINTPAVWERERVVATDMDLDVVRFCDGRVEIVDQDEFDVHRAKVGYPADVVEAVERAAARAFDLVVADEPPFDGVAAEAWASRARERALFLGGP
jgi:protein associated with RNAse G/E